MNDILGDLPATRTIPAARAQTLRLALERVAHGPQSRRPFAFRFLIPAGLGTAAVVAAIVVVSTVLSPKPAYASWTARADALTSAEITELGTTCAASVRELFPMAASDLRPVLGERRGMFQTALIASGPQLAMCADWLGTQVAGTTRGGNLSGLVLDAVLEPGASLQTIAVPGQLTGSDAARIAFGLVSGDVAQITVTTEDGKHVVASVNGGYFLAWWPSGAGAARIEAFDAAGRSLARQARGERGQTPIQIDILM